MEAQMDIKDIFVCFKTETDVAVGTKLDWPNIYFIFIK